MTPEQIKKEINKILTDSFDMDNYTRELLTNLKNKI
jgi:hypothetical protein